jgi:hypothetical protein
MRYVPIQYIWPSELNLMAVHANLQLIERHADWVRRRSGTQIHLFGASATGFQPTPFSAHIAGYARASATDGSHAK